MKNIQVKHCQFITHGETIFISYNNTMLLGVISSCGPPSCTPQKRSSSLHQFCQEEDISEQSFEKRAYLHILKAARVFLINTGSVGKR